MTPKIMSNNDISFLEGALRFVKVSDIVISADRASTGDWYGYSVEGNVGTIRSAQCISSDPFIIFGNESMIFAISAAAGTYMYQDAIEINIPYDGTYLSKMSVESSEIDCVVLVRAAI